MTLTDDQLDLCSDVLDDMSHKELCDLIIELVLPYFDKEELIEMIDDRFSNCDWQYIFEEYVESVQ